MNCPELPATGAGTTLTAAIAMLVVLAGVITLVLLRRTGLRGTVPIVVLAVAALGLALPAPAEASTTDCVTTTAATSVPATTTTIATSTTTPDSTPTTTTTTVPATTIPSVALCSTLSFEGGGSVDVFFTIEGGTGTYVVREPGDGTCGGTFVDSGEVVDAAYVDPETFCEEVDPDATPIQGTSSGTWSPPIPDTWYACIVPESPPTDPPTTASTSTSTTTTTTTTAPNGPPVAGSDFVTIDEDDTPSVPFDVLTNDTDPDGDTLVVTSPGTFVLGHGTLNLAADGTAVYQIDNANPAVNALNSGETLTDTASYTISDGQGNTAAGTVEVTINGNTDTP